MIQRRSSITAPVSPRLMLLMMVLTVRMSHGFDGWDNDDVEQRSLYLPGLNVLVGSLLPFGLNFKRLLQCP